LRLEPGSERREAGSTQHQHRQITVAGLDEPQDVVPDIASRHDRDFRRRLALESGQDFDRATVNVEIREHLENVILHPIGIDVHLISLRRGIHQRDKRRKRQRQKTLQHYFPPFSYWYQINSQWFEGKHYSIRLSFSTKNSCEHFCDVSEVAHNAHILWSELRPVFRNLVKLVTVRLNFGNFLNHSMRNLTTVAEIMEQVTAVYELDEQHSSPFYERVREHRQQDRTDDFTKQRASGKTNDNQNQDFD
jgi:hypothetical protein